MCRLFVWNDPVSAAVDPVKRFQVGHVVEVLEDGISGGLEVDGHKFTGQFQVIEMPGVPAAKYEYLKRGDDPELVSKAVHPRLCINILDLAALKLAAPPHPQTKIITAPNEKAVTDLVMVTKPVPVDAVIGANPLVIG